LGDFLLGHFLVLDPGEPIGNFLLEHVVVFDTGEPNYVEDKHSKNIKYLQGAAEPTNEF